MSGWLLVASLAVDRGDFHGQQSLPVADLFVIAFAAAVFDRVDLFGFEFADYVRFDACPSDGGLADFGLAVASDEEDPVEGEGFFFGWGAVDVDHIPG